MKIPELHLDIVEDTAICPSCGATGKKHSFGRRKVRDFNMIKIVKYSKHYCTNCEKYFSQRIDGADKNKRYSNRVIRECVRLRKSHTLEEVSIIMRRDYKVEVPQATIHDWVVNAEEKRIRQS